VITRENFLEWRKKFEEEMKGKLGNKDSSSASQSARLTGILASFLIPIPSLPILVHFAFLSFQFSSLIN
jgi:hypothetical protein